VRRLAVRAPGSCGEWIQGVYRKRPCLVSCPIDRYATATITDRSTGRRLPPKARQLTEHFLWRYGLSERVLRHVDIELSSQIPRGKGMASSTADLAALAAALGYFFDMPLEPEEIAKLCIAVEPSDNIMYPESNLFDFVNGGVLRRFDHSVSASVLILDFKGAVDTVGFRGQREVYTPEDCKAFRGIIRMFQRGTAQDNLQLIGNATTRSALLNQKVLVKPYLPLLIDLSSRFGGAGVIIGHSGTVVGVLHAPGKLDREGFLEALFQHIAREEIENIYDQKIISGGVELLCNEF
jgi:L-threonine kinase